MVVADSTLDEILAIQIAVAWAGEASEPRRLGWWNTDLVDLAAGGDVFARLLPRTGAWAALASVREVARRVDALGRQELGEPDQIRTLFSLGFELDERLDERLREFKRRGASVDVLALPVDLERYSLPELRAAFRHGPEAASEYAVVPGGRQMKGALPDSPTLVAKHLAAALFATDPMPEKYPLAFYRTRA